MKRVNWVLLGLLGVVLVYGVVSMVIVAVVYGGQFPRYDRPDMSVSAGLRYEDIEADYPRDLVSFKSGDNLLQGYVYGSGQDRGLVVLAHGIGGGADSYLSQISYFVDQGWCVFAYDASLKGSEAIFESGVPVLVIHGRNDDFVSFDGVSLYSRVVGSGEGNVRSLLLSEPGRSGHSDLFDSLSSLEYIEEINVVYGELYEEYDEKIPYEVKRDFYAGVDRFLANGLDLGLMGEINGFFLECVE